MFYKLTVWPYTSVLKISFAKIIMWNYCLPIAISNKNCNVIISKTIDCERSTHLQVESSKCIDYKRSKSRLIA